MDRNSSEYEDRSKELLKKNMTTKIKTTMISAIAAYEEALAPIFKDLETPEQREVFEAFQRARSETLKKGHKQIENAITELNLYKINWLRYQTKIPIMRLPNN